MLLFRGMPVAIVLAILAGALIAIWTSPLEGGIKACLTACLVLLVLLIVCGWGLSKLIDIARRETATASATRFTHPESSLDAIFSKQGA